MSKYRKRLPQASTLVLAWLAGAGILAPARAQHPLDPLSAEEIRAATRGRPSPVGRLLHP
jgi:hypothetical protein